MIDPVTAQAAMFQTSSWIVTFVTKHHRLFDSLTEIITVSAFLHSVLPPWDWNPDFVKIGLHEFPTAQNVFYKTFNNRWYRVMVYVIGFVALHARSTVWRSISVNNPTGPNANVPTTVVETVTSEKVIIPDPNPPANGGH